MMSLFRTNGLAFDHRHYKKCKGLLHFALLLNVLVLPAFNALLGQKSGCTDLLALNYDSLATTNDGSCVYASTKCSPKRVATLPSVMGEVSGMVYWQGRLVMLNDGGNPPSLYVADTGTGRILQVLPLEGASNIDWEDLTQDSTHFYIGDFGNNAGGNRNDLLIYKVDKRAIPDTGSVLIPRSMTAIIRFTYPDQVFTGGGKPNSTAFDAESLVFHRGKLHLFTKNWTGTHTVHYVLSTDTGTQVAQRLDSMDTRGFLITGAAFAAGDVLALTGYNATGGCALFWIYGFRDSDHFFDHGYQRRVALPGMLAMGQLESVCFCDSLNGWMAGEAFSRPPLGSRPQLRRFNARPWLEPYYRSVGVRKDGEGASR